MGKQSFWRVLLAAAFLFLAAPWAARAADITVDAGGVCTLAEAINSANYDKAEGNGCADGAGADTITLETDVTLTAALPDIISIMTIEGQGHKIDGNGGQWPVLKIPSVANLTLNKVTVTGGDAINGGGIYALNASVTLNNSTISGNAARYYGGGIYAGDASVTLNNSTVSGNATDYYGGGIYSDASTVTMTNSTVSDNETWNYGGGIANNSGTVMLINSTVSGNSAIMVGGGIANHYGIVMLNSSTVSGNSARHYGGGIFTQSLSVTPTSFITLKNCLISGNSAEQGKEIFNDTNTVNVDSYNIFGHSGETKAEAFYDFTPGASDVNATSDGAKPTALAAILSPLADNGGSTQTHALVAGSPAIDLDGTCNGGKITTDQRGYNRPVGSGCDAGAFEYSAAVVTPFKVTASAGTGGSIFPAGEQTVNDGETISFTVTPATGYTAASAVGGTCPQGSWNGSTYTTGAIKADCSVVFSFTANGTASKTNMAPIYKLLLKR